MRMVSIQIPRDKETLIRELNAHCDKPGYTLTQSQSKKGNISIFKLKCNKVNEFSISLTIWDSNVLISTAERTLPFVSRWAKPLYKTGKTNYISTIKWNNYDKTKFETILNKSISIPKIRVIYDDTISTAARIEYERIVLLLLPTGKVMISRGKGQGDGSLGMFLRVIGLLDAFD